MRRHTQHTDTDISHPHLIAVSGKFVVVVFVVVSLETVSLFIYVSVLFFYSLVKLKLMEISR